MRNYPSEETIKECYSLFMEGMLSKDIAMYLNVSEATVSKAITEAFKKREKQKRYGTRKSITNSGKG